MVVKTETGRRIEIEFYGDYDDVQVDECYYLDGDENEEVSEDDIAYVMDRYAAEIDECLLNRAIDAAEHFKETREGY